MGEPYQFPLLDNCWPAPFIRLLAGLPKAGSIPEKSSVHRFVTGGL